MISRFWKLREWYLEVFLVTGLIMCIFGITDYFRMDILHFRGPYTDPSESDIFTSTIGNINSFTAYVDDLALYLFGDFLFCHNYGMQ